MLAAVLSLIPRWLQFAAASLVAASLASWGFYQLGKREGRQQAAVATMEATIRAFEKRQEIDHEVDSADLVDICVELGGLPGDCEQLRRLDRSPEREQPTPTRE